MKFLGLRFLAICLLVLPGMASAQNKITTSITITNATTNGMTFTFNGSTRTFTNNPVNSATMVLTNNDVTGNGSKTNLLNQIYANAFSQTTVVDTGSNSFNIIGNANLGVSASLAAGLGVVSFSTQTVSSAVILLQGPVSALPTAQARTNVASAIVGAANAPENTNSISQISTAASELMGTTNTQTISGIKKLTNAASQFFGVISNSPAINGTVVALVAGLYTSPILASPTLTNAVNYGNAISSPGAGSQSEQFGGSATSGGDSSLAVGFGASAAGSGSIAIGFNASAPTNSGESANMAIGVDSLATRNRSMAIGNQSVAQADSAVAIGFQAEADAPSSQAIGVNAIATHTNSTAIGFGAATTAANQIILGGSGINAVVQNNLTVQGNLSVSGNVSVSGPQTNATFIGTNNFPANSDIAFTRKSVSTIANGNNSGVVVGTNVFCELSGNSAGFAVAGFAGGRDGKMIIVVNQTGFAWTNLNESGLEATPSNRIRTLGNASDLAITNGACTFIYSSAASRWLLISHNP